MAPSALIGGRLIRNMLLDHASIVGALVDPIYVDFISGAGGTEPNAAVYTWSAMTVGPGGIAKSKDRLIVVVEQADDNNTDEGDPADGVTVGGVAATRWVGVSGQSSENENGIGIWTVEDTGLVTADVVCTYFDQRVRGNCHVFNVGNIDQVAPHFVNSNIEDATGGNTISMSVQCAPGEKGIVVGGSIDQSASPGITWTNATEEIDTGKGTTVLGIAHVDTGTITDTGTVTCTFTGNERRALACAVWKQKNPPLPFTTERSQNIREINYIDRAVSGANATSYTFTNQPHGRIAGAGEQKSILLIPMGGDGGNQSAHNWDSGDCNVGSAAIPQLIVSNSVFRSTTSVTVSCGALIGHISDTGTTGDVVIKSWTGGTLTRCAYMMYAVYHDSGTSIEVVGTNSMDSGGGSMMLQHTPGSYVMGACKTYDGDLPNNTRSWTIRDTGDVEGGDYQICYDDGDDTGGNLRYFGGDTGSPVDNKGSPGGFRQIVILNGLNNRNAHICWAIR